MVTWFYLFFVGHEMHKSLEVEHEEQELPITPSGNLPPSFYLSLENMNVYVCVVENKMFILNAADNSPISM